MEDPVVVYLVGTAGSGKSTFTHSFAHWMKCAQYDAITVNLDPGAEELPYQPDIDIREWIKLEEVMTEYGLGPNGAQVLCADLLAMNISEVKKEINQIDTDYVLVDTPGQIELFAFRESSRVLTQTLSGEKGLIAYLFDPVLARQPAGMVSLMMLSATVQMRFMLPSIGILSKSDLLKHEERDMILEWIDQPDSLMSALMDASNPTGVSQDGAELGEGRMQVQLNIEFFKAMETIGSCRKLLPASAEMLEGMEDVYNAIQANYLGGQDLDKR
jgi:GTPase SAR1 family protein